MVQLKLANKIIYFFLILVFISCSKRYNEKEVRQILDNKIEEFCKKRNIVLKGNVQDTIFNKYKTKNYEQFNLTYYSVYKSDTTSITATLFTDNGEIKILELKNLEKWKK